MSAAAVKVRAASLAPVEDGDGARLLMTTVDGLEVSFLLDDLAVALLSFTAGFIVRDLKKAQDAGVAPLIFKSVSED